MSSPEYKIEAIVMLVLAVSPILAGDLRHHADDTDTINLQSRLVVKCDPPNPHVPAKNPGVIPAVMEAMVTVTAMGATDQSASAFDGWMAAIDANLSPVSYPAGAIAQATTDFPLGFVLDVPTSGYRTDGQTDSREISRTFRVIYRP